MGNQMQNAFQAAGEKVGKDLGDMVNDALDKLEKRLDESTENGTLDAIEDALSDDGESQEEQPGNTEGDDLAAIVNRQAAMIEEQEAKIDRLVEIMGKMVTKYGASVGDGQGENVNTSLGEKPESDIPLLSEIQLGR